MSLFQEKWPDKDIDNLIKLVYVNPCLWNLQSEDYKNLKVRDNAFNDIAIKIGIDKEEVRRKFRILRSQYLREVRHSRIRGYPSRWTYFNSLKFLSGDQDCIAVSSDDTQDEMQKLHHVKNENVYNTDIEDDDVFGEEFLDAVDEIGGSGELITDDINPAHADDFEFEKLLSLPVGKRQNMNYETDQSEADGLSRENPESTAKRPKVLLMKSPKKIRDEYTIFGEHVANELRILKNRKHLQKNLKCDILQAIIDVNRAAERNVDPL